MRYFSIFFKRFTNHSLLFAWLDEKHNWLEILRNFSNVYKNFRKKKLTNLALDFWGFGGKTENVGKFCESFPKYSKCLFKKIANLHYLRIFFKKLTNQALSFCAFGRKTQGYVEKILKIFDEICIKICFLFLFSFLF